MSQLSARVKRGLAEQPPWLVELYSQTSSGEVPRVVGAGFHVGDGRVLTCAHTVTEILGIDASASFDEVVGRRVTARLTHLPQVPPFEIEVRADGWRPVRADGSGDVAVLGPSADAVTALSVDAIPAPLRRPPTLEGHRFSVRGFPRGPGGVNATGVLRGHRGPQGRWVQLEDVKTEGAAISGGFSGAPVWDVELSAVVGMIVTEYLDERAKIASMIPVAVLEAEWPPLRERVRWRLDLDIEAETHWLPKAQGVPVGDSGWYFTGRRRLLSELSDWLARPPGEDRRIRVITGRPGSGKSAVLAMLVVLADPVVGPLVPLTEAARAWAPPLRSVDVAVHARGKALEEVVAELAAAANLTANSEPELLAAMGRRPEPFTFVVDALDEALPGHARKIARFIAELARDPDGRGRRVLVGVREGSRSEVGDELTSLLGHRVVTHTVDSAMYLSADDLTEYAQRRLSEASAPGHPYRRDSQLALEVASAVAKRAHPLFLVAQLTCQALILNPAPLDTGQPGWQTDLPSDVSQALDEYLGRFGERENAVRDLLTPLAYAELPGLPAGDLWAELASAMTHVRYNAGDINDLLRSAASYLIEDQSYEGGRSCYRLYHQELVVYCRRRVEGTAAHRAIASTLRRRVARLPDGRLDWTVADRYTRSHLPTHASAIGDLDELLEDVGFMVAMEPRSLLAALARRNRTPSPSTRAYEHSQHRLHGVSFAARASYLELAARTVGANETADALAQLPLRRAWSTPWARVQRPTPHVIVGWHDGDVAGLAVAAGGTRSVVVSACDDGALRVWDVDSCEMVGEPLLAHDGPVRAVVVGTLNGRPVIVSGGYDRTIRIWDIASGVPVGDPLLGHEGAILALAMPQGEPVVVSGSSDYTMRAWDMVSGRQFGVRRYERSVRALAVGTLAGRPVIVVGNPDGSIFVTDLATGEPAIAPIDDVPKPTNGPSLYALAMGTLDERPVIATGYLSNAAGTGGLVKVWDIASGKAVGSPLRGHERGVLSVAMGKLDGRPVIVAGGVDRTVRLWDLATADPIGEPLRGHDRGVRAVGVATIGSRLVVTSGGDRTVRRWDLASNKTVQEPTQGGVSNLRAVTVGTLKGRQVVVTGSDDRTVRIWDLTSGEAVGNPMRMHEGSVHAVGILSERQVLVSGGPDGMRLWDMKSGQPVEQPMLGHSRGVLSLAVGTLRGHPVVVSGGADGSMRVWDVITGEPLGSPLRGHDRGVFAVAFSTLGARPLIVSGSGDRTLRVWDLQSGGAVQGPLEGHTGMVLAVAAGMLKGRSIIVSSGEDRTLRVWDLASGEPVRAPLRGHDGWVQTLAVGTLAGHPVVVSGGSDRTLRTWNLTTGAPIAIVELDGPVNQIALFEREAALTAVLVGPQGCLRIDIAESIARG